jgi:ParB family chromosome partitioning protein
MTTAAALHTASSSSWYTPPNIVEAARAAMGRIDMDPASCALANETVRASLYFTEEQDGLAQPWGGIVGSSPSVFLNPPSPPKAWWMKLVESFERSHIAQAIYVSYSVEALSQSVGWSQRNASCLPMTAYPICFPRGRIRYMKDVGGKAEPGPSPPHASAIVALGIDAAVFAEAFKTIGPVMVPR